jgi:hypothetical protein
MILYLNTTHVDHNFVGARATSHTREDRRQSRYPGKNLNYIQGEEGIEVVYIFICSKDSFYPPRPFSCRMQRAGQKWTAEDNKATMGTNIDTRIHGRLLIHPFPL